MLFGSVGNNTVVSDFTLFSGLISIPGLPNAPQNILYAGSQDNSLIWDHITNDPSQGGSTVEAPLFSWDFINDGIAGNDSNSACGAAIGPTPPPGFIALIERGGCNFNYKLYYASLAGAIAGIVYNADRNGEDLPQMFTPAANIPGMLIGRTDGLALLKLANDNANFSPMHVVIHPTNLAGAIDGTFVTNPDGTLNNVNLNVHLGDQNDSIFLGTLTSQ